MRYAFHAIVAVLLVISASALELPKEPNVGVYLTDGSQWFAAPVEIVNWRSGGVVKHVLSDGIIKEDLNGIIPGGASSMGFPAASKIEVLIHTTEGTAAEEYRLLRLRPQSEGREFQSVTGGLHAYGGAQRDMVAYKSAQVAPRMWKAELSALPEGEYGFLPPLTAPLLAASTKIYTFEVGKPAAKSGSALKKLILNVPNPVFDYK